MKWIWSILNRLGVLLLIMTVVIITARFLPDWASSVPTLFGFIAGSAGGMVQLFVINERYK